MVKKYIYNYKVVLLKELRPAYLLCKTLKTARKTMKTRLKGDFKKAKLYKRIRGIRRWKLINTFGYSKKTGKFGIRRK